MERKRLFIGLALFGLMAVAIAATTVQRVLVQAVASDGTDQFRMSLQAIKIYMDDSGARLMGRGSFLLTRGTQQHRFQLHQLTAMSIAELEEGGYHIMMQGIAQRTSTFFPNRTTRPERGTFRLVIFDQPAEDEASDTVEFYFVDNRGRFLNFSGEVTAGTLQVSTHSL
ncbi:MAG: hypothetical protein ABDI19_10325 [Armatimonadota bacterium]